MVPGTFLQLGKMNSLWSILLLLAIALVVFVVTLISPGKRKKK